METYCNTQSSNGSIEHSKNVNMRHNRRNEAPKSIDMGYVQRPSKAIVLYIHNHTRIKSGGYLIK